MTSKEKLLEQIELLEEYDKETKGKYEWIWCGSKCRICGHKQLNIAIHLTDLSCLECHECRAMASGAFFSYATQSKDEVIEMMTKLFGELNEN